MSLDTQIVTFTKETNPIIVKAEKLFITSSDEMKEATATLSLINQRLDAIKAEKDKVLKPLKAAADAEKARWKPMEDMLSPLVDRIRGLMAAYQTAEVKRKKEEEAKIAARIGEGKGKLKIDTAIRQMSEVETVEEKVATDEGSLSFRVTKTLKITHASAIPDIFWVIDEKLLLDTLKLGTIVPGAEIEEIQVPINRR